jgi:hypothetical protein
VGPRAAHCAGALEEARGPIQTLTRHQDVAAVALGQGAAAEVADREPDVVSQNGRRPPNATPIVERASTAATRVGPEYSRDGAGKSRIAITL